MSMTCSSQELQYFGKYEQFIGLFLQGERRVAFRPAETVMGGGEFLSNTTNRSDFIAKQVCSVSFLQIFTSSRKS